MAVWNALRICLHLCCVSKWNEWDFRISSQGIWFDESMVSLPSIPDIQIIAVFQFPEVFLCKVKNIVFIHSYLLIILG